MRGGRRRSYYCGAGRFQESRDWPTLVAKLTEFAIRAQSLRVEGALGGLFIRAKITAQAEFCKDIAGALATANEAAEMASVDPLVNFMIDGTIGRQLLLAKRYQEAGFWLGRAYQAKDDCRIRLRPSKRAPWCQPRIWAGRCRSGCEVRHRSNHSCRIHQRRATSIDRVRAWSELGVAQFFASGAEAAFPSWDKAGEYLFTMTNRNDFWKEQMVLFGHTVGYLAKVAETGKPPAQTIGGEPYTPPERGIFMTTNPARAAFFNARNEGSLWRILGYYAGRSTARTWRRNGRTVQPPPEDEIRYSRSLRKPNATIFQKLFGRKATLPRWPLGEKPAKRWWCLSMRRTPAGRGTFLTRRCRRHLPHCP